MLDVQSIYIPSFVLDCHLEGQKMSKRQLVDPVDKEHKDLEKTDLGTHDNPKTQRAHFKVPTLQTPPKFNERTPKREEERKMWREGKKRRNFERDRLRPISTSAKFWKLNFWTTEGGGPEGWRPKPRKSGAPRGGAPKGGEPKISLFFPSSRHNFLFFLSLGVLSWNFGGV